MTDANVQFFLAGDVYLDIFDANNQPLGLIGPMNGETVAAKPEADRIDQLSKMRDSYGQVRNSVNLPKPSTLTLALRDVPTEVLAMALGGSVVDVNETAQTVTDESVTAKLGRWVDLQYRNINAGSVVVTDSGGTITYLEGTDYEINYHLGLIRAIEGGAITDGQSLLVDYATSAVTGKRITAMTRSQFKCRILVDGVNMADDNKQVHAEIYRATLTADGEIDLLAEEHLTVSFTGTMETPAGKSEPYTLDRLAI